MGEHQDPGVHFVMVEEKRNILIGYASIPLFLRLFENRSSKFSSYSLGIFVGFAAFFFMEKTLRVLGGEDESGGHSHSHSHSNESSAVKVSGTSAAVSKDGLRTRGVEKSGLSDATEAHTSSTAPSKLSAYLNLFGDFVHNMSVCPSLFPLGFADMPHRRCSTDGLAYVSLNTL